MVHFSRQYPKCRDSFNLLLISLIVYFCQLTNHGALQFPLLQHCWGSVLQLHPRGSLTLSKEAAGCWHLFSISEIRSCKPVHCASRKAQLLCSFFRVACSSSSSCPRRSCSSLAITRRRLSNPDMMSTLCSSTFAFQRRHKCHYLLTNH